MAGWLIGWFAGWLVGFVGLVVPGKSLFQRRRGGLGKSR